MSEEIDFTSAAMNHTSKMCWSCDGQVSSDAKYCPYCAANLMESISEEEEFEPPQKNLSSLYKPPYTPTQSTMGVPSFDEGEDFEEPFELGEYAEAPEEDKKQDAGLWPLLFLSAGMNLLTLGLLLFFFSSRGRLTLEWNSHFWFVYCILSTPFLTFGWKLLKES